MPDWSYHPLFRPWLFRLPATTARDLTLGALGRLAALPRGLAVVEFLGHMRPPTSLQRTVWGIAFPGPVGLGAGVDQRAVALPALARFGFGFLEVGPVTRRPVRAHPEVERRGAQQALWYPDVPVNAGMAALASQLARIGRLPVPLGIRLAYRPGADADEAADERADLIGALAGYADFFVLGPASDAWSASAWERHLDRLLAARRTRAPSRPLLLTLTPDLTPATAERWLAPAVARGIDGVLVGGGLPASPDGRLVGPSSHAPSLSLIRALRATWGDRLPIIGAGGLHEPAAALRLLEAGATLVQVESGLVYAGPGLPKRINEAVAAWLTPSGATDTVTPAAVARRWPAWRWTALLGAGMVVGGGLVWLVAATSVVLPYDEAFVGLSRAELAAINPRLLSFMAHDRVTLAGTMIAIGVLYWQLAVFGIRQGMHWAWRTVRISGAVGFASFFLALGFGYVDPLHALVTLVLFPFYLLGSRQAPIGLGHQPPPNLRNDRRWWLGVWGQFLAVSLGLGLTLAGVTIAAVGVINVFVPEDLAYLGTTAAALQAANARLLPLVAHDRAGFGGALVANGLAVLLPALWGFRQGARWLWWTLLAAGTPGFAAALGVHLAVGYLDLWHLAPALVALLLYLLGLILAYPYLCAPAAGGGTGDGVASPTTAERASVSVR